jgi:hypothetical protein
MNVSSSLDLCPGTTTSSTDSRWRSRKRCRPASLRWRAITGAQFIATETPSGVKHRLAIPQFSVVVAAGPGGGLHISDDVSHVCFRQFALTVFLSVVILVEDGWDSSRSFIWTASDITLRGLQNVSHKRTYAAPTKYRGPPRPRAAAPSSRATPHQPRAARLALPGNRPRRQGLASRTYRKSPSGS